MIYFCKNLQVNVAICRAITTYWHFKDIYDEIGFSHDVNLVAKKKQNKNKRGNNSVDFNEKSKNDQHVNVHWYKQ